MSQEGIWEKSLNDEVSHQSNSILIKRNFPYELNDITLRNYLNIHKVDDISTETIYDYFKDNMFKDFNGLYLPHLLCKVPYTSYDKIFKALEETFKVISPNIGTNNEYNMNYFQYYMTIWRDDSLESIGWLFKDIYELGIRNGLDENYMDTFGYTNFAYYYASATLDDIFENYKFFKPQKGNDAYVTSSVLEKRATEFQGLAFTKYLEELKKYDIFKLLYPFLDRGDLISGATESNEYKEYKKVMNYISGK